MQITQPTTPLFRFIGKSIGDKTPADVSKHVTDVSLFLLVMFLHQ